MSQNTSRNNWVIKWSLVALVLIAIAFSLSLFFWQNDFFTAASHDNEESMKVKAGSPLYRISINNELLAARLKEVQQLDKSYATIITQSNDKTKLDSLEAMIQNGEAGLRNMIDSLSLTLPDNADEYSKSLYSNMVSSYTSILQNRSAVASLRNIIKMNKQSFTPAQMDMLRSQNELIEKSNKIIILEAALKVANAKKEMVAANSKATSDKEKDDLKNTIDEQDKKIAALAASNATITQAKDKFEKQFNDLNKDYAELNKRSTQSDAYKNKIASLEQDVDELNAELRLARVDCNLTRVDAAQIISNSKQRKELLSEASSILTNLSKTEDAGIKKKVQEKISRLNQVAASSRD